MTAANSDRLETGQTMHRSRSTVSLKNTRAALFRAAYVT